MPFREVCGVILVSTWCTVCCATQTISFDGPRQSNPDSARLGVLISSDWNGDGKLDIATIAGNSKVLIFEGDGMGGLKPVSELNR